MFMSKVPCVQRSRAHPALQRSQHHVCCIQTVNEIRREGRSLFNAVDRGGDVRIRDEDSLKCRGNLLASYLAVRLDNRETNGCRPNYRGHLFFINAS